MVDLGEGLALGGWFFRQWGLQNMGERWALPTLRSKYTYWGTNKRGWCQVSKTLKGISGLENKDRTKLKKSAGSLICYNLQVSMREKRTPPPNSSTPGSVPIFVFISKVKVGSCHSFVFLSLQPTSLQKSYQISSPG